MKRYGMDGDGRHKRYQGDKQGERYGGEYEGGGMNPYHGGWRGQQYKESTIDPPKQGNIGKHFKVKV